MPRLLCRTSAAAALKQVYERLLNDARLPDKTRQYILDFLAFGRGEQAEEESSASEHEDENEKKRAHDEIENKEHGSQGRDEQVEPGESEQSEHQNKKQRAE